MTKTKEELSNALSVWTVVMILSQRRITLWPLSSMLSIAEVNQR